MTFIHHLKLNPAFWLFVLIVFFPLPPSSQTFPPFPPPQCRIANLAQPQVNLPAFHPSISPPPLLNPVWSYWRTSRKLGVLIIPCCFPGMHYRTWKFSCYYLHLWLTFSEVPMRSFNIWTYIRLDFSRSTKRKIACFAYKHVIAWHLSLETSVQMRQQAVKTHFFFHAGLLQVSWNIFNMINNIVPLNIVQRKQRRPLKMRQKIYTYAWRFRTGFSLQCWKLPLLCITCAYAYVVCHLENLGTLPS